MSKNEDHNQSDREAQSDLIESFDRIAAATDRDAALQVLDTTLFGTGENWLRISARAWRGHGDRGPGFVLVRVPEDPRDYIRNEPYEFYYMSEDDIDDLVEEKSLAPLNLDEHVDFVFEAPRDYDPETQALFIVVSNPSRVYRWTFEPSPPQAYEEALDQGLFDEPTDPDDRDFA